jgi:SAM-dependent methyltransferase
VDRFDFFAQLPRTQPGAVGFTSLLLTNVEVTPDQKILDLQAGAGDRSVWLARSRCRNVVSHNEDERYTKVLEERAQAGGASPYIETVTSDMLDLPFKNTQFNLILAEWAATANGLRASLNHWGQFLAPDGFLALSYPGVKNKDAPVEARGPLELRMAEPMDTIEAYHQIIVEAGFEVQFQLPLPEEAWDNFYADTLRRVWSLSESDSEVMSNPVIKSIHAEAKWYRRVGRGRVFLQGLLLKKA